MVGSTCDPPTDPIGTPVCAGARRDGPSSAAPLTSPCLASWCQRTVVVVVAAVVIVVVIVVVVPLAAVGGATRYYWRAGASLLLSLSRVLHMSVRVYTSWCTLRN